MLQTQLNATLGRNAAKWPPSHMVALSWYCPFVGGFRCPARTGRAPCPGRWQSPASVINLYIYCRSSLAHMKSPRGGGNDASRYALSLFGTDGYCLDPISPAGNGADCSRCARRRSRRRAYRRIGRRRSWRCNRRLGWSWHWCAHRKPRSA